MPLLTEKIIHFAIRNARAYRTSHSAARMLALSSGHAFTSTGNVRPTMRAGTRVNPSAAGGALPIHRTGVIPVAPDCDSPCFQSMADSSGSSGQYAIIVVSGTDQTETRRATNIAELLARIAVYARLGRRSKRHANVSRSVR